MQLAWETKLTAESLVKIYTAKIREKSFCLMLLLK